MSDDTAQKLIMDETDPVKAKSLGDRVNVKPGNNWLNKQDDVIYKAVHAKFSQNPVLTHYLNQTGDMALVEATWDKYWAAGTSFKSPLVKTNSWPGQNKTGTTLMKVCEALSN